jgi:hypothetical protein
MLLSERLKHPLVREALWILRGLAIVGALLAAIIVGDVWLTGAL